MKPTLNLMLTGLVVLIVPATIVWASASVGGRHEAGPDSIRVETRRSTFESGDTIRVWVRNVGEGTLEGTPSLVVLRPDGGSVQSFSFAQFAVELGPGEAVWVDWRTAPGPGPCYAGQSDASGAESAKSSYPCPMMDEAPADASVEGPSGAGGPRPVCYDCRPWPSLTGRFVLVGMFGEEADASVIRIE